MLSAAAAAAAPLPFPVIDTHIHLFDPGRPGGIPWPPPDDPIRSKPTYPDRFRSVSSSHGVTGAIVVECSPRIEDNQWVLDIASEDESVLGLVGFLDAGKPGFGDDLERFTKNPLFRGIRYGNLWGRDLAEQLGNSRFIDDMRLVASADLSLDHGQPESRTTRGHVAPLGPRIRPPHGRGPSAQDSAAGFTAGALRADPRGFLSPAADLRQDFGGPAESRWTRLIRPRGLSRHHRPDRRRLRR